MRTPSPLKCGLDLVPPLADRFIFGMAPSITARYFSSCPSNPTSRWTLCPPMNLRLHRPARLLHPAFGYDAPHSSARGTLTLLNNALLGAQYDCGRHLQQSRAGCGTQASVLGDGTGDLCLL